MIASIISDDYDVKTVKASMIGYHPCLVVASLRVNDSDDDLTIAVNLLMEHQK